MSWEEDFPEWFRRRRRIPFRDFPFLGEKFFENMDKVIEDMFKEFTGAVPRDLVRERKLPDGSTAKEFGPFVYGYSMTVGPDGKPVIREFGNVKPSTRPSAFGAPRPKLDVKEGREPLVDIIEEDGSVKIIAELPGVEKNDIAVQSEGKSLTISVDNPRRKYFKELDLPTEIDPESARASYKNGVLEVTLNKTKPKARGREIKID